MRCLLVLSETAARLACSDYLSLHGHGVDSCADADEGEALARFREYDCVIADLQRDGTAVRGATHLIELCRRRNPTVVPVVLTTTDTVRDLGMQSVVAFMKPVPLRAIVDAVEETARAMSAHGPSLHSHP
jgi:DNA-binding response OmpR family regulator